MKNFMTGIALCFLVGCSQPDPSNSFNSASMYVPPSDWTTYSLSETASPSRGVVYSQPDINQASKFQIVSVDNWWSSPIKFWVQVTVRNLSGRPIRSLWCTINLYDVNGKLIESSRECIYAQSAGIHAGFDTVTSPECYIIWSDVPIYAVVTITHAYEQRGRLPNGTVMD